MLLSRFWRRHRRLLGWSIFVLAIAGLGVALYVMLPPEPRWVFADGPRSVFYAGDGKFATYRLHEDTVTGPVQLWDAAAAEELARFLTGEKPFRGQSYSNDGRYFVALVNGDRPDITRICGVDLHERREWQVDAAVGRFRSPVFSPRCDFVAALVSPADGDAEVRVIVETSSGRIVD